MCCLVAAAGIVAALAPAAGAEVSGAGATFPYPIYAKWAEAYGKESGVAINYQPVGSGDGIRQIQAKQVTFGASDMPLSAADIDADHLVQFPTVMGGIAVVVNIDGVKSAELILDGTKVAGAKCVRCPAIRRGVRMFVAHARTLARTWGSSPRS